MAGVWSEEAGTLDEPQPSTSTSTASDDSGDGVEEAVEWLRRRYGVAQRGRVRPKALRALAALRAADPSRTALDVERDLRQRAEVLDELGDRLGWKFFVRWPEEFAHPDALECWAVLLAFMIATLDYDQDQVSALVASSPSLLALATRDPGALASCLSWLANELDLTDVEVAAALRKNVLLVQCDVESQLAPRLAWLRRELPGLDAARALQRYPELFMVDSACLAERLAYLTGLGLDVREVAYLANRHPQTLTASITATLEPLVAWLRGVLAPGGPECEAALNRVLARSPLVTRSLETYQARYREWLGLGFAPPQLARMLRRFPTLLARAVGEPRYAEKLHYLTDQLGQPLSVLEGFPQYLSYSFEGRIRPRAAAYHAALASGVLRRPRSSAGSGEGNSSGDGGAESAVPGAPMPLSMLAVDDEAFCQRLGLTLSELRSLARTGAGIRDS